MTDIEDDKRPILVVSYKHYEQLIKHFGKLELVPYRLEPNMWYDESRGTGFNVTEKKYQEIDKITDS